MAKKIDINEKWKDQFNRMVRTLDKIANNYYSADRLHIIAEEKYGISPEDAIEMAYENIQHEARSAVKGIREIKLSK